MAIFGLGKKKPDLKSETVKPDTVKMDGEGEGDTFQEAGKAAGYNPAVKILGSGCAKCEALEVSTREALKELGMDVPIDHVTDFVQIASYGVMSTPALVLDGKVVSLGKVLKKEEVVKILKEAGNK